MVTAREALRERLVNPAHVAPTDAEATMPPYMESLLAHLRLLVGVPFDYLVPDARLLQVEWIRFFYLDRSWTDRLVDGAVAVGKIGTREQAHHQSHEPAVRQQLDLTERIVRDLQRRRGAFASLKEANDADVRPADLVTGFLLRSAAVSGWPHMDVRAYRTVIPEPFEAADHVADQLTTLRLERLSPAVMLALFQGVPELVVLEEPHHGVQFGVHRERRRFAVDIRTGDGRQVKDGRGNPIPLQVPVRDGAPRVIAVAELRRRLAAQRAAHPEMPLQTGSASFAIEVLSPPWRQRFEGTVDHGQPAGAGAPGFVSLVSVAPMVANPAIEQAFRGLVTSDG